MLGLGAAPQFILSGRSDFLPLPPSPLKPTCSPLDAPYKEEVSSTAGGWGFCPHSQSCGPEVAAFRIYFITAIVQSQEKEKKKKALSEHLGLGISDLHHTATVGTPVSRGTGHSRTPVVAQSAQREATARTANKPVIKFKIKSTTLCPSPVLHSAPTSQTEECLWWEVRLSKRAREAECC